MPVKQLKNRTRGRKRVYATELPVYDSMEQCSGATKVPIAVLKIAKRNGCLFIRHGRVQFSEFIEWFFNQPPKEEGDEDYIDWGKRDKRAAALIKEANLEKVREQVIDFAQVERFVNYLMGVAFFGELDRIANEFPANLKGKGEIEISAECAAQIVQIKKLIKIKVNEFVKKKGNV